MALPSFQGSPAQVKTGPGYILMADYSSATNPTRVEVPDPTVVNGRFDNEWPGWHLIGYTDAGITLAFDLTTEDVEVAEEFYPIKTVSTTATGTATFAAAQINQRNLERAMNGGIWEVTGTGDTAVSRYTPPILGKERRSMLGWIGPDNDEMFVMYKVFQAGTVTIAREKGANKATLSMEFRAEIPEATPENPLKDVWSYWYSGSWADSQPNFA